MAKITSRTKRTESFWIGLIQKWREAGEPPKTRFALECGVPPSTFSYWITHIENGRRPGRRSTKPKKVATSVYLTHEQHEQLLRLAELTESSLAEVIRRGAELVLQENADLLPESNQQELDLKDGTTG